MKIDRRIRKTKLAIREALVDLLKVNSDLNAISITDICKVADINRKTFYNNYRDLNDLMNEIENEIVTEFKQVIDGQDIQYLLNNSQHFFDALTSTIESNYGFYSQLISKGHRDGLVEKVKQTIILSTKDFMIQTHKFDELTLDFVITYVISGIVALYQQIFSGDIQIPKNQISKYLKQIVIHGVESFIVQ